MPVNGESDDAVRLLIETGVMTEEDAQNVKDVQTDALLNVMVNRRVLLRTELGEARKHLRILAESSNRAARVKAQTSLVGIITANLHRRMERSAHTMREHRQRLSSASFAAVGQNLAAASETIPKK